MAQRRKKKFSLSFIERDKGYLDYGILFVVIFLLSVGALMVYSTTYYSSGYSKLFHQAIISICSVVLMVAVSYFPYENITKYFPAIGIILATLMMIAVNYTPLGIEVNGSKRWLGVGSLSFQPTEFVKLAVIIFLAAYITKRRKEVDTKAFVVRTCGIVFFPLLFVADNNLSSGLIIFFTIFFVMLIASEKKKGYMIAFGLVVLVILVVVLFGDKLQNTFFLKEYQYDRIEAWLNPEDNAQTGGYQILQSLYALGSGGLFGKGLGNSVMKLGKLPEAQNDMIFSIICEELGIFGAFCILIVFVFLFYKLFNIAKRAKNTSGFFYVAGVIIHLMLQVIFNIAVVTNSMPNTGVTLPFISYGGTSVLFLAIEMGIVLNIDKSIKKREIEIRQLIRKRQMLENNPQNISQR